MGAYEHALKYAQERLQFGKPIGSFQLVQDLLAKMLAQHHGLSVPGGAHGATACRRQADGRPCGARQGVLHGQVPRDGRVGPRDLGGNGIVADYNVARFFADAEALYSYEGTYQMQNLIVGKAITGLSAFV